MDKIARWAMAQKTEKTTFTKDVQGRYTCNTFQEALASTDTARFPYARPFDIVIIGGGSFGPALAQELFYADKTRSHRILVLEAGQYVLPEHVQNLPMIDLGVPGPTMNDPGSPRNEVWGLPWRTNVPGGFPGLAYAVAGRSLYFGGWSPRLLDAEMPTNLWPQAVMNDLKNQYFDDAAEEIGVDSTNDFIYGDMHQALRRQLFEAIQANKVTDAVPFADLTTHLEDIPPADQDISKLEAPLAVQGASPRSGNFPFNKFSAMPLLMEAVRTAQREALNNDPDKRLMLVNNCHVKRLVTETQNGMTHVVGLDTNHGYLALPSNGQVVIALGTIESARLAAISFPNLPNTDQIGRNLMAHLRSNKTIRIPRTALKFLDNAVKDLQASALFVKGKHTTSAGDRYFHLQITASGLSKVGTDSEADLFKKIPDIDLIDRHRTSTADTVVITIRGIGEMEHDNPNNSVSLTTELDEYGLPRAFVQLKPTAVDLELWDAMDRAADQVATVFANGGPMQVLDQQRDGLGTTHHEAGTLRMGTDPTKSVTNADGCFHFVDNAFALGPCLHPTSGSPNPMLTGIALALRMSDHLTATPPVTPPAGFQSLFDGKSLTNWQMSTIKNQPGQDYPGHFTIVDGALEGVPGTDLGLLWCTTPTPANFVLRLQWQRTAYDDNSGVFIRFPDPNSKGYNNTAWVAINFGFEVQIDELGRPDGAGIHKTGAIYAQANQQLSQIPAKPIGEWNDFEITAQDQTYTVRLNGQQVATFTNTDTGRGLPSTAGSPSFIGLQTHTGRVRFRNIFIKTL